MTLKINRPQTAPTTFGELEQGQLFTIENGNLCLKTDEETIDEEEDLHINCVCLTTSELHFLEHNAEVKPVSGELSID